MAGFSIIKALTVASLVPSIFAVTIGNDDPTKEQGLLGDLLTKSPTTNAGFLLAAWLQHVGTAIDNNVFTCRVSTCCVWDAVSADLTALFFDPVTQDCNDDARAAIRLGFHDAASWSKKNEMAGLPNGGADGSMLLFREDARPENNGLQDIVTKLTAVKAKHNVGAADLIQFAAQHATVTCPQGPRIAFFAGRIDANQSAPLGLVPDVHDSAQNLIDLFMDKTINAVDFAALLGAHTSAKQFHFDEAHAGESEDSTPGIWDTNFYNETLQAEAPTNVTRFPSDLVLSQSVNMTGPWKSFVGQQEKWNEAYAFAYTRIGLLGVNNIDSLIDCSGSLPPHVPVAPSTLNNTKKIAARRVRFH